MVPWPISITSCGGRLPHGNRIRIADAHVVIYARRSGEQVVATDPIDLRRLDPHLEVDTV